MTERLWDEYRHILSGARTIAVVGASAEPGKSAHEIPAYLQRKGFRVIPVNPHHSEVLGVPAVPSLLDIGEPIDIVDVFRPAPETPDVARDAVAIGARALWLQLGIVSDRAHEIAESGGLSIVMNRCLGAVHAELELAGDI
ncbi:CoA-binding protein [Streptomyces diastatochromogenes]|uniref:Succinate--CoA ligase n=1 Tax=Streptomyces diastatochromogenes TaxID=42236 RepID=A0A233SCD4_STRDA|nr:CoA-binding protein [Streptomyces diastatochromogenes]MCZ0988356.1 CoA-binding protein [Streptomyces diastatochromogenes]OXY93327.1 succinate--CoA ligase [Streptomyces diastatochromogenes]